MIVYVDTSAAMKLLVEEAESEMLADHLQSRAETVALWWPRCCCTPSCIVRRIVGLSRLGIRRFPEVLSAIALVDLESGDLTTAPLLPGCLPAAAAIHLAAALRLNARAMVVYDTELRAAARTAGVEALSPGAV